MKKWLDQYQLGNEVVYNYISPVLSDNTSVERPIFNKTKEQFKKEAEQYAFNQRVLRDAYPNKFFTSTSNPIETIEKNLPYTLPNGQRKTFDKMNWREKNYVRGKALKQRGKINKLPDALNPLQWVGDIAGNLAQAPYEAQQSNSILPYLTAIATPLVMGRSMGSGSINPISKKFWTNEVSNAEFLNNMALGVPGMAKGVANKVGQSMESGLLSNTYKINPPKPTSNINLQLFGFGRKKPIVSEVAPLSQLEKQAIATQEDLARANRDAITFSQSPANRAKLQEFRPGQDFSVTNQQARFIDDPEALKLYESYKLENDPSLSIEQYLGGSRGQYGARNYGDLNDVVLIDKNQPFTSNIPSRSAYTDAVHETTHSRSIRLGATDAEKKIASDAWSPMIKKNNFGMPEEEAFAVQNELRTDKLKDITGERVYTEKDIPEIKKGLQDMINEGHDYLRNVNLEDFNIPALIKSLNKIGLGSVVLGVAGKEALQKKKKGGVIKDNRGQWAHPGKPTRISSPNITMEGVPYPVLAKANNGMTTMMYPEQDYYFPGANYVDEYPMMQGGGNVAPFITSDINEYKKRKQAYDDSLRLYNLYRIGDSTSISQGGLPSFIQKGVYPKKYEEFLYETSPNNFVSGKQLNPHWHSNIKPIGLQHYTQKSNPDNRSNVKVNAKLINNFNESPFENFIYKKPVQQVLYKEKENLNQIPTYNNYSINPKLTNKKIIPQQNYFILQPSGAPVYTKFPDSRLIGYNTSLLPSQIGYYTPEEINKLKQQGIFQEYEDGGEKSDLERVVDKTSDYLGSLWRSIGKGLSYVTPDYESVEDRELLFKRYRPVKYPGITTSLLPDKLKPFTDKQGDYNVAEEAWRKALGLKTKDKYLIPSKYKPLDEKNKNSRYYTLNQDIIDPELIRQKAKELNLKPGSYQLMDSFAPFVKKEFMNSKQYSDIDPMQKFKLGVNKNGKVYIYDKYDFDFEPLQKVIRPYEYEFYDEFKHGGEMIKRADGSYSRRGLWDNIRNNRGSGKKPTKQMLEQERKIRNSYQGGGTTGKKRGNTILDWWNNLDAVQGTYKMYNEVDPFLKNWYQHPETQKRLKQNLQESFFHQNTNPSQLTSQAINILQNTPTFSRELVKKADVSASDLEYNNELQGWKSPSTFGGNPYFNSHNYITGVSELGSYNPNTKQIIVNSFNLPGTIAHEGVHAAQPLQKAMEDVIDWKYFNKKDSKAHFVEQMGISNYNPKTHKFTKETFEEIYKRVPKLYDNVWKEREKYLNKDGMYPRIMDIRRTLNLKPGQKVDKSILSNDSIYSPLEDLRHYYDDETIINILNTIAKTNNKRPFITAQTGKEVYWRTNKPMVNDPSMDAISKVLLQRNLDKNFMQRAAGFGYQGGIPTKYIPGQDPNSNDISTLLMGSSDNIVYPTIIQTGPEQLSYQPYQTQEYIEAPSWDVADYFATKGYKRAANDMYGMEYQKGGENNNLKNINLNLPIIRHQEMNPLHINGFLVNDRNQNLFIGGINPRYQNENFSVGPYMIGVGNKYFQKFPADMGISGTYHVNDNFDINMGVGQNNINAGIKYKFANGGYVVRRSHDRKGKTHVVIGPDGTKKYFGDPNMGERGKSKHGKEAFYARHKHNLAKNPYFRAYARATWEDGGQIMKAQDGKIVSSNTNDFLIQPEEYHLYTDRLKNCAEGRGCLEQAFNYYDNYIAPTLKTPSSWDIKEKAGISSGKKNPRYADYEESADSWDIHGLLQEKGAKKILAADVNSPYVLNNNINKMPKDKQVEYFRKLNLPVGAIIGMGVSGGTGGHYGTKSYNKKKGLASSNHSAVVIGYDNTGLPILYDYGYIVPITNRTFSFPITNITAPKETSQYTYDYLKNKNMLENNYSPLEIKTNSAEYDEDEYVPFVNALTEKKKKIANALGLQNNEYDELARKAAALALTETGGGDDTTIRWKFGLPIPSYLTDKMGIGDTRGITQINTKMLFSNPQIASKLKNLDITEFKYDPWNPEHIAAATMALLQSNIRPQQSNYKKNVTKLGYDPNLSDAAISYYQWNQPKLLRKGEALGDSQKVKKFVKNYNLVSTNTTKKLGGQSTLNPITSKDNRNWLDFLKN